MGLSGRTKVAKGFARGHHGLMLGAIGLCLGLVGTVTAAAAPVGETGRPGLGSQLAGASWEAIEAPAPPDAATNPRLSLFSVSCGGPTSCVAVGTYYDTPGAPRALVETWGGTSWAAAKAPVPTDASEAGTYLSSVSCPRPGSCAAVGWYFTTQGGARGLMDVLSGGVWTATAAPLAAHADRIPGVNLTSVSCSAPGSCVAVGWYEVTGANGATQGLLEMLSDGRWTALEAPLPPGANSLPGNGITSVSCVTNNSCAAFGSYVDSAGMAQGLLEVLKGGTWVATEAPLPAGVDSSLRVHLVSVGCANQSSCVVAGYYSEPTGGTEGLLEVWSAGTWTAIKAPLPAGMNASPESRLSSVSCSARLGDCLVVGNYYDNSGTDQGLLDSLSSGTWTATAAPQPADLALARSSPSEWCTRLQSSHQPERLAFRLSARL